MHAQMLDEGALRSVRTTALAAYLRATGWTQLPPLNAKEDKFIYWEKPNAQGYILEVLVPKEPLFRDYARRISEALQSLAHAEHHSAFEIRRALQMARRDVIRIRLLTPQADACEWAKPSRAATSSSFFPLSL